MKKNVGGIDRVLRVVVGLLVIGLGVYFQSWWGVIGVLLVLTALVRWCPPYSLFGINTSKDHHA